MKGSGLLDSPRSQLRPAAATKTQWENSGKDHKLWPGRFPGTGEYGRVFHGKCVKLFREALKYPSLLLKIQSIKTINTYIFSNLQILQHYLDLCSRPGVASPVSPGCRDSEEVRQETVARRLGPAPHTESPLSHCVWLLIKAAIIITSWSPEGASNYQALFCWSKVKSLSESCVAVGMQ